LIKRDITRLEFINYISLKDGQVWRTIFDEADKWLYSRLARLFDMAVTHGGAEIIKDFRLSVALGANAYVASMWYNSPDMPGMPAPILTTAGSLLIDPKLILLMHESATLPSRLPDGALSAAPFIIERLDFGLNAIPEEKRREALMRSGDLCRCLGWYIMAPREFDA